MSDTKKMDLEVRKTVFGAILWMGVQKIFELLSHHVSALAKFETGHKLLFELVTLFIAVSLVYAFIRSCGRTDDRR